MIEALAHSEMARSGEYLKTPPSIALQLKHGRALSPIRAYSFSDCHRHTITIYCHQGAVSEEANMWAALVEKREAPEP